MASKKDIEKPIKEVIKEKNRKKIKDKIQKENNEEFNEELNAKRRKRAKRLLKMMGKIKEEENQDSGPVQSEVADVEQRKIAITKSGEVIINIRQGDANRHIAQPYNRIIVNPDVFGASSTSDVENPDNPAVDNAEMGFWNKIQSSASKAFDTIKKAFKRFGEDVDENSEERKKLSGIFGELKDIYAVQKIADTGQEIIGDIISTTAEYSRDIAIATNRPIQDVMKQAIETLNNRNSGVVADSEDIMKLYKAYIDAGIMDLSKLNRQAVITLSNDEEIQKAVVKFGKDAVDTKTGTLTLDQYSLFQDAIDRQAMNEEQAAKFQEMLDSGMNIQQVYEILSARTKYRGTGFYNDVAEYDNYFGALNDDIHGLATSLGKTTEERYALETQMLKELPDIINQVGNAYANKDLILNDLQLFTNNSAEAIEEQVKKYGYDSMEIRRLVQSGKLAEASEKMILTQSALAEQARKTGNQNLLIERGYSIEELSKMKDYASTKDSLNLARQQKTELADKGLYDTVEPHYTIQEKIKSWVTGQEFISKALNAVDSIGLDIADIPGLYLGGKMVGGVVKSTVKGVGNLLGFGAEAGAAGTGASIGGKLMGWLMGGGTGAKALVKGATTKIAAPLSILETLYQGFTGYKKADELEAGKINSTVSHMLGGNSSGVGGAAGNALKWGSMGALIGSVVPVVGTAIGGAIGAGVGAITGYFGGDKITKTLSKIPESVGHIVDDLKTKASETRERVVNYMSERIEITKADLKNKWEATKSFVNESIEVAKSTISERWESAKSTITTLWGSASEFVDTNLDNIKSGYNNVVNSIVDGYNNVGNYITEKYNSIYETIKGKLSETKESVLGFIQSIIDGMKSMYNSVTEKFSISYWKDRVFGDDKEPEDREKTKGIFSNITGFFGFGGDNPRSKSSVVDHILKSEGGYVNDPDDKGGETRYGITKARARALGYTGDMKSMPKSIAENYYSNLYDKMQNKYGYDEKATAMITDLAVNSGEGRVKDMLAYSGGDYNKMMEWRNNYYERIVEKDPSQKKFLKGWKNRLVNLNEHLGGTFNDIQPVSDTLMTLDTQKVKDIKDGDLADSQSGNIELAKMLGGLLGQNNTSGDNGDVVNAIGDTNSLLKLLVVALTRNPRTPGLVGY